MKLLLENWRNYVLFENIETASRLSIFDFDETIAFTEGHVNVINKITGEEFKTASQEEYDELTGIKKNDKQLKKTTRKTQQKTTVGKASQTPTKRRRRYSRKTQQKS